MMRTPLSRLALYEPATLADALRALRRRGPLVPLAGCTDLYVAANAGTVKGQGFLNLWRIDELRGLSATAGVLRIGALTTYADLLASPLIRRRLPMLAQAAREVGSVQIRNRGTVGGNIANGSPAGDTLPVLAVADAVVVLRDADGERRVPLTLFYTGYRASVMRSDELIVAVEVPPVPGIQWFRKVGTRAAQAISKIVVAGLRDRRPRLAFGSVGPTVIRAWQTETCLAEGGTLLDAQAVLATEIHPIDDLRSTAAYRARVAANLLARFWADTGTT